MQDLVINTRRGVTILESTVALAFIVAGVVATSHVLAVCARHRLVSEQSLAAQLEAANVREHIATMPYGELQNSTVKSENSSFNVRTSVTAFETMTPPHKLIKIDVSWPSEDPTSTHHVNLTTWRFAPPEAVP